MARFAVNVTFRRSPARFRAFSALFKGRWAEAETLSAQALEETPSDPDVFDAYAGQLVHLRREQGRLDEILPTIRAGLEGCEGSDAVASAYRSALALCLCDRADLDEALQHFEILSVDGFAQLPRGVVWVSTLALLTEVCAALRDTNRARALLGLFAPHTGHLAIVANLVACLGAVDRYLAMLESTVGDWQAAEAHFDAALALEERIQAPPLIARTQYWYGSMLLDRGQRVDRQRGHDLLRRALQGAQELGMVSVAAQARSRLAV